MRQIHGWAALLFTAAVCQIREPVRAAGQALAPRRQAVAGSAGGKPPAVRL